MPLRGVPAFARDGLAWSRRVAALTLVMLSALGLASAPLGAQAQPGEAAIRRAIDFENAAKYREAIAAYREALAQGALANAILGLERSFGAMGQEDSVLAVLDAVMKKSPGDATLRGVQLRSLRALGRDAAARRAFDEWRALDARDAAPYREFARLLLTDRRTAEADSVLRLAVAARGSAREFASEFADLYAAMGRWPAAAAAWREAIADSPYLDQSASFALMSAPPSQRDSVRLMLAAPAGASSVTLTALARARAWLELHWGTPREGWNAIKGLPANDSTAQLWTEFADEAEHLGGALAARDALLAAYGVRHDVALQVKAAALSLAGGDAPTALRLAELATPALDSSSAVRDLLPVRARALAQLARPADAERVIAAYGAQVTDAQRRVLSRAIAWGWIRAGDIPRARQAAARSSADDEDVVSGWLALFDGDLDGARRGLRTAEEKTPEIVTALAFISRAKQDTVRAVGAAFLALARGDSARASREFASAAPAVPNASSFLLGFAARIASASGDRPRALAIWQQIVATQPSSPEAPEADLEWARALDAKGDRAGATARYEHLILTWPDSALVPQARAALDRLRLAP